MQTKTILAVAAVIFLVLAAGRIAKDGGRIQPASKTWLTIGVIFASVSAWLFYAV